MHEVSGKNFGLLIAYVIPGAGALLGVGQISPTFSAWLSGPVSQGPTIGGFLYVSLAVVAAGMTVSTIRWALIDTLHHLTGVRKPNWDFSLLQSNLGAFDLIVEHQYRYYQFHSNGLVAVLFLLGTGRATQGFAGMGWLDVSLLVLASVLFVGSRDTLRRYYSRGNAIMALRSKQDGPESDYVEALHERTPSPDRGTDTRVLLDSKSAGESVSAATESPPSSRGPRR